MGSKIFHSPFFMLVGDCVTIMTIDPSFAHFAITIYDGDKTIYLDMVSFSLGDTVGFEKIYSACHQIWEQLRKKLRGMGVGDKILIDTVFSEVSPPQGSFSPGLYALDVFILSKLFDEFQCIKDIYCISPSYLSLVHGTRKYKKSDSTALARYFMDNVLKTDFEIRIPGNVSKNGRHTKGTLNNDKAESFLFMMRAFSKFDVGGKRDSIISEVSGFGHEAERLLCHRE